MKTKISVPVALFAALTASLAGAQTHKVTAPETVVRAVGVYEWTGDLTKPTGSRFVPVSVFIDGEIQDAGVYLPRPVPFALVSGNVYELEDAGLPKGTVELEGAFKTTLPEGAPGPAFDAGWTAYGSYRPPAAPRRSTAAALRPMKTQPVIVSSSSDNRPHLTNKSGDASKPSDQTQQTDASKQSDATATPKTDDPDRPTMKRRDTSNTSDTTASSPDTSSSPSTKTSSDDEAERPTLKRRSPDEAPNSKSSKKNTDVATVRGAGSLNDDPDRPTLKHGSKEESASDMPKLLGVPKDMHQMVAVSDAKNREPHPFARPWETDQERAAVLAKMQAFAREKLTAYGIVPGITPPSAIAGTAPSTGAPSTAPGASTEGGPPTLKRGIPQQVKTPAPKPAPSATTAAAKPKATTTAAKATAKGKRTAAAPPVSLADEDLKGYLLSYGGAPTYVYMAHTVETGSVMRYVTVVAQADAMGELKVALASVTDAAHLDRTPWMRLIDAVDVEASDRASLLFELRGQSSRQFALYRVIAAKPEQIFATSGGA